ncbi:PD-(D/E)XK nuclease-like domain-containing protein [Magnetospirillum molischianum]|nr:PD-(D/E)XK nuclease-like domain-containing protein [Magnetospirillum molischianum]
MADLITNLAEARAALAATGPGIYDMPNEVYHADPCPTPSLSAGGVDTMLDECPARFWWESQRLNPSWEATETTAFGLGKAAHIVFLEPGLFEASVRVIEADDYKTKAARTARDEARAAGQIPLLTEQHRQIIDMRDALFANSFARAAFERPGRSEVSAFWRDPVTGVWCRLRADRVPDDQSYLIDYKTAIDANPLDFGRAADNLRYYRRAAWYLDGWQLATGNEPKHYWFVVQEKSPPYLASVIELDSFALDAGRQENREALDLFARCLKDGQHRAAWPGYRRRDSLDQDTAFRVGIPPYAHQRIAERGRSITERAAPAAIRRAVENAFIPGA